MKKSTIKLPSFLREWPPEAKLRFAERLERRLENRANKTGRRIPFPRQQTFLDLQNLEALYGGAAGGGKSEALLEAALQYVHVPRYSAVIFRRTFTQLSANEGLIERSHEILNGSKAKWSEKHCRWQWPNGAILAFRHMQHEKDKYNHQGPAYHFVGFDELTQFTLTQYTFLISRVRRRANVKIPLRIRGSANPGGIGHNWVKLRFICKEAMEDIRSGVYKMMYEQGGRVFVPSRMEDNIGLDRESYELTLNELDPVTRMQYRHGDWTVAAAGRINTNKLKWYEPAGDYTYQLLDEDGDVARTISAADCRRLMIVDCAATAEDVARQTRGKEASHTVISVFDITSAGDILWRDLDRGRWEAPEICRRIQAMHNRHRVERIGIEDEKTGRAVLQILRSLPVYPISHQGKDKVARFGRAAMKIDRGEVYLPNSCPTWSESEWTPDLVGELAIWTGHPDEAFDQGDTLAYAALQTDELSQREIVIQF